MSLSVQKMLLHQPSLEEVAEVLQKGLSKNFSTVEVNVVPCPDLTAKPFCLAEKGLSGKPRILDVGGPDYLRPTVQKDKKYSFAQISELGELPGKFLIGAGAGPCHHVGVNSELICNINLATGENGTRIVRVNEEDGSYTQREEKSGEFSLLGNFYLSEGKPGKVLEIRLKDRTGSENFVSAVHKTLTAHYGDAKAVGVGGTFLLATGKANIHVMPDFSSTPLVTDEDIMNWLKFYEMDAPLVHVGEIVSADPEKLHLRCEHFHCFSDHGQGGHYHFDTTPSDASYLGYLNLAEAVYRIDLPEVRNYVF